MSEEAMGKISKVRRGGDHVASEDLLFYIGHAGMISLMTVIRDLEEAKEETAYSICADSHITDLNHTGPGSVGGGVESVTRRLSNSSVLQGRIHGRMHGCKWSL
jgi:hypothetical protein